MKTVVITGAAGGMGGATAALFKSRGYQILGTDNKKITGVDFEVVGDVADEATWQKITGVVEQNKLELTSLINIAGRNYFDLITDAKKDEWLNKCATRDARNPLVNTQNCTLKGHKYVTNRS